HQTLRERSSPLRIDGTGNRAALTHRNALAPLQFKFINCDLGFSFSSQLSVNSSLKKCENLK
uniref:hypothetical protein n=1 Tax=Hassallia byssoidea TaxID=482630 RepID=UPI001F31A0E2